MRMSVHIEQGVISCGGVRASPALLGEVQNILIFFQDFQPPAPYFIHIHHILA